ncbi:MAG: biotin carboxylase N-terminal domain-containing protein, partial [Pseudomonadota bacterium]
MIDSLLIANRGEIACRIIRTAKRLGVRTIAVYSEADADALHVRMADEAHFIGPAAASESYLRAGRILKTAKEAGAAAIHPGYGFMSENADFAQLTRDAKMVFVGPPPDAIRAMGLKDRAKEIMSEAGVPVVPGYHGSNQDPAFLKRKAYEIGYPVLIKAVAGGGGKGMRKVAKALEFDDALVAAKREAKAAFGNDAVLIERFVRSPRHIEVQVFADGHGNVVHLFERDCSLQRRHQKVIEEAPAPGMSEELRAIMGKAACEAARAVGYEGAGTVEFIVDSADGLSADGFFFMEMNTRLQVEHPVTEAVTGLDLVEWQLRVASGEALPVEQDEIRLNGHAVEARLYAEDPSNGFLPSTGKLIALDLGNEESGLRIDSGVETGDVISPFYDPMIAKVIAHAPNRAEAMEKLALALDTAAVAGPRTNSGFLARLCRHPSFLSGDFDTCLIDESLPSLIETGPVEDYVLAAGLAHLVRGEMAVNAAATSGPWAAQDGFQLSGERVVERSFQLDGEMIARAVAFGDDVQIVDGAGERIEPNGEARLFEVQDGSDRSVFIVHKGRQWVVSPHRFALQEGDASTASDGLVTVPMHGRVIGVSVAEGDVVEAGDILFSVEAMKMEHAVLAPVEGVVED